MRSTDSQDHASNSTDNPQALQQLMSQVRDLFHESAPTMTKEAEIKLSQIQMEILKTITESAEQVNHEALINGKVDKEAFSHYLLNSNSGPTIKEALNAGNNRRQNQTRNKKTTGKKQKEAELMNKYLSLRKEISTSENVLEENKNIRTFWELGFAHLNNLQDISKKIRSQEMEMETMTLDRKLELLNIDCIALGDEESREKSN